MKLAHDSIMSGHQGVKKTTERVTVHFFWPGVHGDVTRYCRSCDICQKTVSKGRVPATPLGKMPLIEVPSLKQQLGRTDCTNNGPREPLHPNYG